MKHGFYVASNINRFSPEYELDINTPKNEINQMCKKYPASESVTPRDRNDDENELITEYLPVFMTGLRINLTSAAHSWLNATSNYVMGDAPFSAARDGLIIIL